jgi:hypothetical protein
LNTGEGFWSGLESRLRNGFSSPSPKQLEDILQEEWYKILLRDCSKLVRVHSKKDGGCTEGTVVQHHISKEMCTVSVVFPLFCPTPVYAYIR